jgi:hypothetical protein
MLRSLLVVLLAGGLAGCAAAGSPPSLPSGTAEARGLWTSCADIASAPDGPAGAGDPSSPDGSAGLPRLGEAFTAVAAVTCLTGPADVAGGGTDLVATEQRAEQVDALVTALRLPDEPHTADFCTADGIVLPWLVLLDAQERWVRPGIPMDECGKPRTEVRTALDAVVWHTVSSRKVGELTSAQAAAAGCEQNWADMAAIVTSGPPVPPLDAHLRLCVYTVAPEEQGSGKPRGDFASGGPLSAQRWARIRPLLTAAGVPACDLNASRFALLIPDGLEPLYVEMDGCRRILAGNTAGQASPQLIAALDG